MPQSAPYMRATCASSGLLAEQLGPSSTTCRRFSSTSEPYSYRKRSLSESHTSASLAAAGGKRRIGASARSDALHAPPDARARGESRSGPKARTLCVVVSMRSSKSSTSSDASPHGLEGAKHRCDVVSQYVVPATGASTPSRPSVAAELPRLSSTLSFWYRKAVRARLCRRLELTCSMATSSHSCV